MNDARPSYEISPFCSGLSRHRATAGSLVAEGLAPEGEQPERWTVTRVSGRGWTEGGVGLHELRAGGVGHRTQVCDAKALAAIVRAGRRL